MVLTLGTIDEIIAALQSLQAPPQVIAQAGVSFLVRIPGARVSKTPNGYKIGESLIPSDHTVELIDDTQNRFRNALSANDANFRKKA